MIACTLLAAFFLNDAPVLGEIPSGLPSVQMPVLEWGNVQEVFYYALMLALLGSIDSLLTSLIADNVT